MLRYLSKIIGICMAFLAQTLIFENIKIFSCSPDILVTAIIICSVSTDWVRAAFLGGFVGLLMDSLCARVFGVNIIIYMYLALIVSAMVGNRTENSPLLMSWVVFVAIAAKEIVIAIFKTMFGYSSSLSFLGSAVFVKGLFGAVFTLLFVLVYHKLKLKIEKGIDSAKEETV